VLTVGSGVLCSLLFVGSWRVVVPTQRGATGPSQHQSSVRRRHS